ncbi:hypothetical protein PR202_ga21879 [Eleusine coracana subsp. coracana]|uniref:Uncharacterized protein n=1 Tax=Eleusine coracana subsp. coracana TaxID=191504 RepID=A0AAV5D1Q5_ELECO|nr:hypothetical protein PR202_ga21879 [Eleusine coracana subsp. coracana]
MFNDDEKPIAPAANAGRPVLGFSDAGKASVKADHSKEAPLAATTISVLLDVSSSSSTVGWAPPDLVVVLDVSGSMRATLLKVTRHLNSDPKISLSAVHSLRIGRVRSAFSARSLPSALLFLPCALLFSCLLSLSRISWREESQSLLVVDPVVPVAAQAPSGEEAMAAAAEPSTRLDPPQALSPPPSIDAAADLASSTPPRPQQEVEWSASVVAAPPPLDEPTATTTTTPLPLSNPYDAAASPPVPVHSSAEQTSDDDLLVPQQLTKVLTSLGYNEMASAAPLLADSPTVAWVARGPHRLRGARRHPPGLLPRVLAARRQGHGPVERRDP